MATTIPAIVPPLGDVLVLAAATGAAVELLVEDAALCGGDANNLSMID